MSWYEYRPYVSAAEKRARGARAVAKRMKKGLAVEPVAIAGRVIARSFWGKAWCDHLEGYSDYANRLPRGRTYARNGSVLHLAVTPGRIDALVQGSDLYEVDVTISELPSARWKEIVRASAGQIDSVVELLQGKLSSGVMQVVTDRATGLFPAPSQIRLRCSCPDVAGMCKHLAAVLYGVGARLDDRPELLFTLRKVDHLELISAGVAGATVKKPTRARTLAADDLADVFGIDVDAGEPAPVRRPSARARAPKRVSVAPAPRRRPTASLLERIVALLREERRGLRREKIAAALAVPSADLGGPLVEALAAGRLTRTGATRGTTYFAA